MARAKEGTLPSAMTGWAVLVDGPPRFGAEPIAVHALLNVFISTISSKMICAAQRKGTTSRTKTRGALHAGASKLGVLTYEFEIILIERVWQHWD